MLKGIHPLLTGAILKALDELGHGDGLVIADANFPAHTVSQCLIAPVIELPTVSAPLALAAVCTVFPIDSYEGPAVTLMQAEAGVDLTVQAELVSASGEPTSRVEYLERFEFYEAASDARAMIRTGEARPYGNVLLRKGVVSPR